jgi:hypothetical protein
MVLLSKNSLASRSSLLPFSDSARSLNKFLNGFEIILKPNPHDVIVGSGRDDEESFFLGPKVLIDLSCIFKRNQAVLFTMDDQGGQEYLSDPLETFLINFFETDVPLGDSEMKQDPSHTGKATLDNESFHFFLMMVSQLQGRETSQGPPHHPQVLLQIFSGELISDLFKENMRILNEIGDGRGSAADSITPVIGNNQVHSSLMIKRSDLIVIAYHLTVPVEKKNPWPFVFAHVKTASDGYTARDPYGEVKGIPRAWGKIFAGIKDKFLQKRLVEKRIINHKVKFSTISEKREGLLSVSCGLDDRCSNH